MFCSFSHVDVLVEDHRVMTPSQFSEPKIVMIDQATGVRHEAFAEGSINVFTLPSSARAAVDRWFDYVTTFTAHWDNTLPQLILLHGTSQDFTMTPLVRKRREELTSLSKQRRISGRLALVIPESVNGHVIQALLRVAPQDQMKTRIFFDKSEALTWLSEGVPGGNPRHN
jgi:hypothetical protein